MLKEKEALNRITARWYDSTNPFNRTLAINLHNGKLTIMTRNNPSDVWSPPKPLVLSGLALVEGERNSE